MTEQNEPGGDSTAPANSAPPAADTPPAATVTTDAPTLDAPTADRPFTARDQVQKPPSQTSALVRGASPKVPGSAPLYRVTKKPHFLNGRVHQPGETVRFAGIPGVLLEPLDEAAKEARAEADKARAKRSKDAEQLRLSRAKAIKALNALS